VKDRPLRSPGPIPVTQRSVSGKLRGGTSRSDGSKKEKGSRWVLNGGNISEAIVWGTNQEEDFSAEKGATGEDAKGTVDGSTICVVSRRGRS